MFKIKGMVWDDINGFISGLSDAQQEISRNKLREFRDYLWDADDFLIKSEQPFQIFVSAVVIAEKRVLMVKRPEKNTWTFPSGPIKTTEELSRQAKSQVGDSLGITNLSDSLVSCPVSINVKGSKITLRYLFAAPSIIAKSDIQPEAKWVLVEQLRSKARPDSDLDRCLNRNLALN